MTRDVWRVVRTGSLDRLRLENDAVPPPRPGEITVSVRSVGLNLADVFSCLGLYSATPPVPFTPGLEVAGVVESVGARTEDFPSAWEPGDRVIALTRFGGFATALNTDSRYVRALPGGWTFEEGAAFPVQALTAWYALHTLAHVKPGDVVLVQSGAGGVGLNALALVRACGARAIATIGSDDKRSILVERARLASEAVIVRHRGRFGGQLDEALRAADAPGFDVVLDGIAGEYFMPAYRRLSPEGRMVVFGASDMMPAGPGLNRLRLLIRYLRRPRLDPMRMISSNRAVMAFNLIWLWDRVDRLNELYVPMAATLRDPPLVGRSFAFDAAPEALRWLKSGRSVGKVVLASEGEPPTRR